jgi:hypothetical protein
VFCHQLGTQGLLTPLVRDAESIRQDWVTDRGG